MYWRCDICDKIFYEEFANNHLQSGYHKLLSDSFIRRYIFTNPKPKKIDDMIRKSLSFHYRIYEKFLVILSVKLFLPSNQTKSIRRQYPCHSNQECINNAFLSKIRIIKQQLYSQILELRVTFVSLFENITFDHYLIKPKPVLEWRLIALAKKNPEIINSFDYEDHSHPLFQEFFEIYLDRI